MESSEPSTGIIPFGSAVLWVNTHQFGKTLFVLLGLIPRHSFHSYKYLLVIIYFGWAHFSPELLHRRILWFPKCVLHAHPPHCWSSLLIFVDDFPWSICSLHLEDTFPSRVFPTKAWAHQRSMKQSLALKWPFSRTLHTKLGLSWELGLGRHYPWSSLFLGWFEVREKDGLLVLLYGPFCLTVGQHNNL